MRKLFSLVSLSILAMVLASPAQASMESPGPSQRLGEPARVQHERVRMQTRAVHEHLRLRRQQAEARARDEDRRSKSAENGGGEATVER